MRVIGIDEVGRGCWAGPLLAAAVVLDPALPVIPGLNDSKKLSRARREALDLLIRQQALAYGIGWVWPRGIDIRGITAAVKEAMEAAFEQVVIQLAGLPSAPELDIVVDGSYNFLPGYDGVRTLVGADGLVVEASAASIIAKVARDRYMSEVADLAYPGYGFAAHVGYGTAVHSAALAELGVTPLHRTSYKPIQKFLLQSGA